MSQPRWTVEVLEQGDPAWVRLGIDWGDGTFAKPVEIEVSNDVLQRGPEAVGSYFLQSFE